MEADSYWSSDVPVSMPIPPRDDRLVPMDGFAMTSTHLAPDINWADFARMATPTYAPRDFGQEVVYEDLDVDLPPMDVETF